MDFSMIDQQIIQKAYAQPEHSTYLNTSSTGLISKSSVDVACKFHNKMHENGSAHAELFLSKELPQIRETVSIFIDAPVSEIALIPNFSYGLCTVIPSILKLKRVLLFNNDYPSLIQPFQINDFDLFWIDSNDGFSIELEELKQLIIKHKIEILALSHVQYFTGFIIDIDELGLFCKQHDVLFIVDGSQSLGAIPFSFTTSHVDIYITSNYKWMNGGFGTGIMCIKKETIDKYIPKIGGFSSYKQVNGQWKYEPSIHSYEPGHPNMSGLALLKDAIEFKVKLGLKNIASHNLKLLNELISYLNSSSINLVGPADNMQRCNIICINGNEQLATHLHEQGIVVKMRNNIIRIGIHFYNTRKDIDHLIRALYDFKV